MFEIKGDGAKATVMTDFLEDDTYSQIQEMINSEAISNDVVIQADCHPGKGSVIGFTMPLGSKIVPNIVGVDVGCGVLAFEIGDSLPLDDKERERKVRGGVPMGKKVHDFEDSVHFEKKFWWGDTNKVLSKFSSSYEEKFGESINPSFDFNGYDEDYFDNLCKRVLTGNSSKSYIIKSVGTLGGGNHFIEFSLSQETGKYWCVIHSGSRYLGKSIAEYWQDEADRQTKGERFRRGLKEVINQNPKYKNYIKFELENINNEELRKWITGGMGESFINYEKLKKDYRNNNPSKIEEIRNNLKKAVYSESNVNKNKSWLKGDKAHGYYVDMIFAQQYARFNRNKMMESICDALEIEPNRKVESTHNYIGFKDMIIRKGATPAREDEELVVPFNMSEGTLICKGRGNEKYLNTAPHGAGRSKSRREAKEEISLERFEESMEGIFTTDIDKKTLDEAPDAYKDTERVLESLKKTAEPIEHLEVVHNLKG